MDDVPSDDQFEDLEPEPDDRDRGGAGRLRRGLRTALTLTLVAALVVLAAIEGSGVIFRGDRREPTPAADTARLAVVDAAGALTSIDQAGGSVVAYSVPGVTFQFPAWSPDGSSIAVIGRGAAESGIYVFQADAGSGAAPAVIYRSPDRAPFYLFWTPDGRQVTFLTTEPDGLALRIAPADGSTAGSVVRLGSPMYWDFVDPARLLVHSGANGPAGFLGEVGPDGQPFELGGAAPGVFRAGGVSRDGRYRAFVAAGSGMSEEVVVEARDGTGSNRVQVFGPAAVSFDPSGDRLAFVAPDQPGAQGAPLPVGPLRIMDPGSSTPRTLLTGTVLAFLWAPDGRTIAALRLEGPGGTVTEARHVSEAAAGLPLRLTFVDVESATIRSDRGVRVSDLFVNQVMPFFDQYALSHRFWAPDSRAIILPIVGEGEVSRLFVIPADGTDPTLVADGEFGSWSP